MLTVLAFCARDRHLATTLAEWIRELGGVFNHKCLLVYPPTTTGLDIADRLATVFPRVDHYQTPDDVSGWPQGANLLMRRAAHQIQGTKLAQPWLWLEPDAVPLRSTWLDEIEAEYKACGKPFMGARVDFSGSSDPKLKQIPVHMSGIAVYPPNAPTLAPGLIRANTVAFDVEASKEILPRFAETKLVQHEWRPAPFLSERDLFRLKPGAAIYHQCKDGSLIQWLRQMRKEEGGDAPCPKASLTTPTKEEPSGSNAAGGSNPRSAAQWLAIEATSDGGTRLRTVRERVDMLSALLADLASESDSSRSKIIVALKRIGLIKVKPRKKRRRRKLKAAK